MASMFTPSYMLWS